MALVILLLSLLPISAIASRAIVIEVPEVDLRNKEDYVAIAFSSEREVLVAYSQAEGARVYLYEVGGTGWVKVELVNNTSVEQVLAFSSMSPIYLNVSLVSSERATLMARYVVPANTTLQLVLHMNPPAAPKRLELDLIAMLTPRLPIWEYAIYAILFAMFLSTAYLDSRDHKRRHPRWGKLDTFSLFIRYGFYASMLSFLFILLGTVISSILAEFFLIELQASIMDALLAFFAFMALAVIYGFAKWRGWYDLVDE